MKATGIVRQLDSLGRVVLPIELRRTMNWKERDSIEIFTDDEGVYLKRYAPGCLFCQNVDEVMMYRGKRVCTKCAKELGFQADSEEAK